jgi:hypothetical protein
LAAKKEFMKPVSRFEQLNISGMTVPGGMTRAYKNTRYTVMVFDKASVSTGTAIMVMVQKHDDTPIVNHWREMQNIKNEIFGAETTAVEYYPAESSLIDRHNIYWFWIYKEGELPIPII